MTDPAIQVDDAFRTPVREVDHSSELDFHLPFSQPSGGTDNPPSVSASELLLADLNEKAELLRVANAKALQFEARCSALKHKLAESRKRQREAESRAPPGAGATDDSEAPRKRPSPDPPAVKAAITSTAGLGENSDDDVPLPAPAPPPTAKTSLYEKPFEVLQSILCAYKDGKIVPGADNLPFDMCVELCQDEIASITSWSKATCVKNHQAVLAALELVYPNKKPEWFKSPFLTNPQGAAEYWSRVLKRRSEIWKAAADRVKLDAKKALRASLQERIRAKIDERRKRAIKALHTPAVRPPKKAAPVCKTPKRQVRASSDSDEVVDLSISPEVSGDKASASSSTQPKRAPPSTYYTPAEFKQFERMALSIRNVDEKNGHSEATAAFIDVEFSGP